MRVTVKRLDPLVYPKWDAYVKSVSADGLFYQSKWCQLINDTFGHKIYSIYALNAENEIVGVLPLSEVKSRLFGHSLVSAPFCVYGGVLFSDIEAKDALILEAKNIAKALGVDQLELRSKKAIDPEMTTKDLYVTFKMDIVPDRDEIMNRIWRKQRTVIRKSQKQELTHTFDKNIDDFFHVYSTSVHNLGTPVFSKKYFQALINNFGDNCEILTVRKNGKAISSVMSFYSNGCVYPYYGGGLPEARDLKSNDYMYYELMCHAAIERACTTFDFGRSKKGTGAFEYKKHWKMEPEELEYQYYLVSAKEMPNLSPTNPKYQLMIRVWQKLPLKLSQLFGPLISKYLG